MIVNSLGKQETSALNQSGKQNQDIRENNSLPVVLTLRSFGTL
jgi:hypothetical protein